MNQILTTKCIFQQSAVKAAIEGRVLILDGIEKAERNVLPILNNLLENREIHLEDGRFLVAPKTYDTLLQVMYYKIIDFSFKCYMSVHFRNMAQNI